MNIENHTGEWYENKNSYWIEILTHQITVLHNFLYNHKENITSDHISCMDPLLFFFIEISLGDIYLVYINRVYGFLIGFIDMSGLKYTNEKTQFLIPNLDIKIFWSALSDFSIMDRGILVCQHFYQYLLYTGSY